MSLSSPSPESWSVPVTRDNVLDLSLAHGFFIPGMKRLVRPVSFVVPEAHDPRVTVCDEDGNFLEVPLGFVPHLRPFSRPGTEGHMATLHHRKGGQVVREALLRILRIAGPDDLNGHPETKFHHGEHPDHPGEVGFYVGAQHLGSVGLDYRGENYLSPDQIQVKYFPIEARGEAVA